MLPLFYHGTVNNSISFLFLKAREQVQSFILCIDHPVRFRNGAICQLMHLHFIGGKVIAHFCQRPVQPLSCAGIVKADKLLLLKSDVHIQISGVISNIKTACTNRRNGLFGWDNSQRYVRKYALGIATQSVSVRTYPDWKADGVGLCDHRPHQ